MSNLKAGLPAAVGAVFLAGWLVACDTVEDAGDERDLMADFAAGAFLPASDLGVLSERGHSTAWLGEAWWRPLPVLPVAGWGQANSAGWRPMGDTAVRLWRRQPDTSELVLEILRRPAEEGDGPAGELAVDVTFNGRPLGRLELPLGRCRGRFPVPPAALATFNDVELRFVPALRQGARGPQPVAVERLGLVAPGADLATLEARPSHRFDAAGKSLLLLASGQFILPFETPPGASELRFELAAGGEAGGRWELRTLALDGDGTRHPLASTAGDGNAPRRLRISLDELRDRDLFLVFDATIEGEGDRLEIRAPRLTVTGEAGGGRIADLTRQAPDPERREPLPDVILILLDAARGDRFLPEHPRRTTPNLDRLAEGALRFRRAYSECPSTACSIPNLITGRPFLAAGIGSRRRLDDSFQTLAESLKQLGYRTVGFSANPNNAKSRNMHQGFDEFHAVWGRKHLGAHRMSQRAGEVIAQQAPETPLYLQLHYLPPHEPYKPKPEFDVFRDRGYQGPIAPRMSLRPYRADRGRLTGADVAQLVDLYDGNLLMADDAVERIFEALKAAGRWRRSIVLVTSDHGEAFWEHGHQGHNATLYDEMLHIPFILRLPDDRRPAEVDVSRLATLGDVVPTLLGLLGAEPPPGLVGVDLLSAPPPDPRRPRVVFHRTGFRNTPAYAARTPRFKVIVRPRLQQQALYDLAADPGERHNLIHQRPLLYAGLALRLRQHLALTTRPDAAAEEVKLPDEDVKVLKSLGYLP